MGIPADDVVLIQQGNSPHDPTIITVNCPDKSGLGCDLCRIILEFGLHITRADFQTDGKWCYIVLWVVQLQHSKFLRLDWDSLKNRLLSVSPPCLIPLYHDQKLNGSSTSPSVYLLKFCCVDRKGLLHDVTELLTELEFTIQRLKVMTTPDGKVVDLFFITDGRELLHTKKRRDDTCGYLCDVFREYCIGCELQLAGPECDNQRNFSSLLNLAVAEELFSCELSGKESCMQALRTATTSPEKAIVTVDNLLSPAHTLLQIQCVDQKGLFYDILRTSKDLNIQVAYGRFSSSIKGYRNMDLFFQQRDGKKILDPKLLESFCSRLKEEMLHPLRVIITNRGPDTELLVANPVELCGKGRPRVFYDVTLALKKLGICIFSAEIGRHSTQDRQWEVYRFLLVENGEFPLTSGHARNQMADRIRRTLMDW
ncbi:ACT DOMAIN-CONTAINING PROTEIN ACR9 [Salix viminalis]|uniref:ACT domain-containing protein ACR n=1 Tax=Salix viminalis TaxID=40686 RepID=A0A9Q0Z3W5_SALVM|nr:ACT DOMAIN-CONTAINING PROTEIN ACR9 [Salix viminalis]